MSTTKATPPPGPAWKPSPARLLGIAPYVQARAGELVRDDNTDELRRLIHDERVRYPMGLALVQDRIAEVEDWVATQR